MYSPSVCTYSFRCGVRLSHSGLLKRELGLAKHREPLRDTNSRVKVRSVVCDNMCFSWLVHAPSHGSLHSSVFHDDPKPSPSQLLPNPSSSPKSSEGSVVVWVHQNLLFALSCKHTLPRIESSTQGTNRPPPTFQPYVGSRSGFTETKYKYEGNRHQGFQKTGFLACGQLSEEDLITRFWSNVW